MKTSVSEKNKTSSEFNIQISGCNFVFSYSYGYLGLFIMLELGISTVASIFSVFVMHLHKRWMKGKPVPHWLLKLTCLAKKKRKALQLNDNSTNTNTSVQVTKKLFTLCNTVKTT